MTENRPPTTIPWRAALTAGAVVVGGLLILLWPAARAFSDAIVGAFRSYGDLIVAGLGAFMAALAIGAVRIVFAIGRRYEAQAKQAAVVQLQNAQPVHVDQLQQIAARNLTTLLTAWSEKQKIEAENSQHPNLTSLHYAYRYDGGPPVLPLVEEPPLLVEPPPGLEEAIRRGWSTPDRWYVGADGAGQPQGFDLKHTGVVTVGGVQGQGKTNLVAFLGAQCAAHGGYLFVGDPHYGDEESLSARIAPFSGAVERFAVAPDEIDAMILKVDKIYQARCQSFQKTDPAILLLIDEFMDLMVRKQLSDDALDALLALSGVGRKKRIFIATIAQNWNWRLLGATGVTLRQNATAALVFRTSKETAEHLLPGGDDARQAMQLQPGQFMFFGSGEPVRTAAPWLSDSDARSAARGRLPRFYVPRALAAPAADTAGTRLSLPPTEPIAPPRPAPPTVVLPPLTVQDQIVSLLRARRDWLTSSEIAAALDLDIKVVRTELTPLERRRAIVRRPAQRPGPERYEYASQSINQSTGPMTLSA